VHRLDGVPVPLRAVLASERPGDEEILQAIAERIARAGEGAA
jgi:formylmethanofuran dehydrogenase subunit B